MRGLLAWLLLLVIVLTACDDLERSLLEEDQAMAGCGTGAPAPRALETPFWPARFRPEPVPDKFVGGYLEHYRDLLPRDLPAEYDLLIFAFARVGPDGEVIFDHNQDTAELQADILRRKVGGSPTLLSIGGAQGAESGLHTRAEQQRLLDGLIAVIDDYRFSGVDWDIEYGVPDGLSSDGVVAVSRALRQHYGSNFSITLTPYSHDEIIEAYQDIAGRLRDDLTYVGYQFYNDLESPTVEHVLAVTEHWLSACGLDEAQWVLGFVHEDDFQGHTTSHATMAQIYDAVEDRFPGVRGVWTWGIADKDAPLGFPFATTMAGHVGG